MSVPAMMIASFSINSAEISYGFFEIGYFLVNGTITWLAITMIVKVMSVDRNNYLEIIAYSIILYAILFEVAFIKYENEQVVVDPTSETPSPPTDPVSPPVTDGIAHLGNWEYFGVIIMIGLRFIYAIYKIVRYCKTNKIERKDESLSISDFD